MSLRVARALAVGVLTAAGFTVLPGMASPVGQYAVQGIVLGASMDFVQTRFPTMLMEETEYEDPVVGLRYKAYLPTTAQRFVEKTVGRIQAGQGHRLVTLRASFAGTRDLYELVSVEEDVTIDCAVEIAAAVRRWGEPDYREGSVFAQWVERELNAFRRLDVQCFPGSGVQYMLLDPGLLVRHRVELRAAVAPYVEQALLQGGG